MDILSLYIHIPFCLQKCRYCDFLSYAGKKEYFSPYVDALINELKIKSMQVSHMGVKTIFIGGGTPTVLPPAYIQKIMKTVYQEYTVFDNAEITIEANPGTLNREMLSALKEAGINRLSIGLQAWQDSLLSFLGRVHSRQEFVNNFILAREMGFQNISIDLMFALPNQTLAQWEETLQNVIALQPEHISAYSLIIEEGTPFYEAYEKGKLHLTDEKTDRQMYAITKEMLHSAGYQQYEISNFAKPNFESLHNQVYWKTLPYLGFGIGAHSYMEEMRYHNTFLLEEYLKVSNDFHKEDIEILELDIQQAEFMFCGLRMTKGISCAEFKSRFGVDIHKVFGEVLSKLQMQGLLKEENGYIFLTNYGVDISNQVFIEFLP